MAPNVGILCHYLRFHAGILIRLVLQVPRLRSCNWSGFRRRGSKWTSTHPGWIGCPKPGKSKFVVWSILMVWTREHTNSVQPSPWRMGWSILRMAVLMATVPIILAASLHHAANGQGPLLVYTVPTPREGGIWATPGPSVDASGNLYVSVGNGAITSGQWDHSDSILNCLPRSLLDAFAPSSWGQENANDEDMRDHKHRHCCQGISSLQQANRAKDIS